MKTNIIKPEPRQGWADAAKEMSAAGDDQPLWSDFQNDFDQNE